MVAHLLLLLGLTLLVVAAEGLQQHPNNTDLVLAPSAEAPLDAPEKLIVIIPGANVPTGYYAATASAIQAASHLRLWVVIPTVLAKKCITTCPSSSLCAPLQARVQSVVKLATSRGYKGHPGADTFVVGHSLGGVCASNLVQGYAKSVQAYAGLVVLGSYVTDQAVATWPTPVLTLGAELDGGLGRPSMLSASLASADSADGGMDLKRHPVAILPGLDHSSFCPGFRVPGDVFPAERDAASASALVGKTVAAFLHQHTKQTDAVAAEGLKTLTSAVEWTRELLHAFLGAQALEAGTNMTTAPWCETMQHVVAGLSAADDARLVVENAIYKSDSHEFEHTRVGYELMSTGKVGVNISGMTDHYASLDISDSCLQSAKDIGCKLVSADRIAEQLGTTDYAARDCGEGNRRAVSTAEALLSETAAGKATLQRFQEKGRPFCFGPDTRAFLNIGPLFVKGSIKVQDNGTCLEVSALALGPQPLDSKIFPGVHYCKVLSPARAVDYMMIDALKPKGGCLNK